MTYFKNKKLIIFLDIDGTLIQENQRPNSNKLPLIIKNKSKQGILFGLNSNRSLHDILPIYNQFKLNGPIILENGVYFKKNIKSKKIFLIKKPMKLKKIFKETTKKFLKKNNINSQVFIADTVDIIKNKKYNKKLINIFLNKHREYTGSIHIYNNGKRDINLANKLCFFFKEYFKVKKINFEVKVPKAFGNIIFYPKASSKVRAFLRVKNFYKNYEFMMIGDDLDDLETLQKVKYFCAVGNASKKVKSKASFTAKNFYTRGVIEILDNLDLITKKCYNKKYAKQITANFQQKK